MPHTGIVIDEVFLQHHTPAGHPERPERIGVLLEGFGEGIEDGLVRLAPRAATPEEITWNHAPSYVEQVAASAGQTVCFDVDTVASPRSYEAACLAVGGFLSLLDAILDGRVDNGFAFVRPPGHHAEFSQAMGFCLFNNVAVGAHYLLKRHGLKRVLIVDWDVHHGNGTEHSFYKDPHVMYISLHEWPHYPGTGATEDVGAGAGAGFTANIPLPAGCGDAEYLAMFSRVIDPIARQFDPQFVLISAGFDAHQRDPLSGMQVSEAGFGAMAQCLLHIARDHAHGRCALILEGGYDLAALKQSAQRVVAELVHGPRAFEVPAPESSLHVFHRVNEIQKFFWQLNNG